jgi:hypothetical protein
MKKKNLKLGIEEIILRDLLPIIKEIAVEAAKAYIKGEMEKAQRK